MWLRIRRRDRRGVLRDLLSISRQRRRVRKTPLNGNENEEKREDRPAGCDRVRDGRWEFESSDGQRLIGARRFNREALSLSGPASAKYPVPRKGFLGLPVFPAGSRLWK